MKKILITGSSGFLGSKIYNYFRNHKYKTLRLDRSSEVDFCCDLSTEIPNLDKDFDLVIHCAGKAHITPKTVDEKQEFYNVNFEGTKNLLKGFRINGTPKYFIFISSVSVYGLSKGDFISETYPLLANDSYGKSKIKAEEVIKDWSKKNKVKYTILRLPLLVGKNPPGNLASMIKALNKGYYFNIGGGKARRSMIVVNDVIKFILLIYNKGGTYNLTDGVHPSYYELSFVFNKFNNKNPPLNMPLIIAKMVAKIGDLIQIIPINTLKLGKLTSTLTFDDSKSRKVVNFKAQSVLDFLKKNKI
tara:strand:- start:10082 stop:10987 length:906 start_codon:yes stop_codon:yes gene_type:complete